MKIQCNACEAAEAKVLCCADEAALCLACDEKVHAANKLAGKHQRVPLLQAGSSASFPNCDICQEASGFFFCVEDRALLCRNCDVAVHSANAYVSAHQRFLLTGIQVGIEPVAAVAALPGEILNSNIASKSDSKSYPSRVSSKPSFSQNLESIPSQFGKDNNISVSAVGNITDWDLNEFFCVADFNCTSGLIDPLSSKADRWKFRSADDSQLYEPADKEIYSDDYLGTVHHISWAVPDMPSLSTASGLHWQKNSFYHVTDGAAFVPDITSLPNTFPQDRTNCLKRQTLHQ